jgi:hypothetical protein
MVCGELVPLAGDVGVHERGRESRDLVQELVLAALGDAMSVDHCEVRSDHDSALGA